MRVRWTRPGLDDFIEACAYIAGDNPDAARRVAQKLWDAARGLGENPKIGRTGRRAMTREWVVSQTPYLLVYRVRNDEVEILRVWHTKRDPKSLNAAND